MAPRPARVVTMLIGLLLGTAFARAQVLVKVNDDINFRFGLLLQSTADWAQDPNSAAYSENIFLRRIRFIALASVTKDVSVFFQTDNPRAGNAGTTGTKIINTGFVTQDAYLEWKVLGEALMVDGGLFYVPQSRGVLNSSSSGLSYDTPTFGLQQVTATGSTAGRDYGIGFKGYVIDGGRLEYRVAAFDGSRLTTTAQPAPLGPEAGSRNSFRAAARVQYDFLDTERAYTYVGSNLGRKKILVLGAWGDTQGDFSAYGADAMVDVPLGPGAVTAEVDYLHYDGGSQFNQVVGGIVTPLLPRQSAVFAHAGYYFEAVKLQPFLRYERNDFAESKFSSRDSRRYAGGLNWYVSGNNLKVTAFYERIVPSVRPATALQKDTNHFAVQLQAYYF